MSDTVVLIFGFALVFGLVVVTLMNQFATTDRLDARIRQLERERNELEEALWRIVECPTADGIAMSAIARTALAESIGREDYKGQP